MFRGPQLVKDHSALMHDIIRMPKADLHAHLNGSVSKSSMLKLLKKKREDLPADSDCPLRTIEEKSLHHPLWCCRLPGKSFFNSRWGLQKSLENAFECFKVISELVTTLDDLKFITDSVLSEFCEDGVKYLELRTTPKCLNGASWEDYVATILSSMKAAEERYAESSPPFCVRLLLSIDRVKHSPDDAWKVVNLAEHWRKMTTDPQGAVYFPGGAVVGVDVSVSPVYPT